jgi:lipopolysaccharide export system protein LptA
MRRFIFTALLLGCASASLSAQETRKCRFRVNFVGDSGRQVPTIRGSDYFAGGGVVIVCEGTSISMKSDSVAAYGGASVVQFIGNVRYRDSTVTMDADNGTYYKDGERWEARGKVHTVNLATGSTMDGPSLDYLRAVKGVRDTVETYSIGRPTIHYIPRDSAGAKAEPYVIVGDRIRQKGENQVWAGGKVTIDRSDLTARGDSLWLRTGKDGQGSMIGSQPTLRGFGKDTFDLTGRRIDFTLDEKDLTGVVALDSAHAVTGDVDLVGDTVSIALKEKKAELTRAWGRKQRPVGLAGDYELRGDSLAIDTPKGELREVRAFIDAWAGTKVDSASGERDWVAGDTVVIRFVQADSAGTQKTRVSQLEAIDSARSFYRVINKGKGADSVKTGQPSLNYARANRIVVRMATTGDGGMERVDLFGKVDGIQLEPGKSGAAPPRTSP